MEGREACNYLSAQIVTNLYMESHLYEQIVKILLVVFGSPPLLLRSSEHDVIYNEYQTARTAGHHIAGYFVLVYVDTPNGFPHANFEGFRTALKLRVIIVAPETCGQILVVYTFHRAFITRRIFSLVIFILDSLVGNDRNVISVSNFRNNAIHLVVYLIVVDLRSQNISEILTVQFFQASNKTVERRRTSSFYLQIYLTVVVYAVQVGLSNRINIHLLCDVQYNTIQRYRSTEDSFLY